MSDHALDAVMKQMMSDANIAAEVLQSEGTYSAAAPRHQVHNWEDLCAHCGDPRDKEQLISKFKSLVSTQVSTTACRVKLDIEAEIAQLRSIRTNGIASAFVKDTDNIPRSQREIILEQNLKTVNSKLRKLTCAGEEDAYVEAHQKEIEQKVLRNVKGVLEHNRNGFQMIDPTDPTAQLQVVFWSD